MPASNHDAVVIETGGGESDRRIEHSPQVDLGEASLPHPRMCMVGNDQIPPPP
jgi:hypothetical protein